MRTEALDNGQVGQVGQVVQALKGLADPTRLRLLSLLRHGELTVGEICRVLGQSQPRVSRHLRLLSEAGFLDRFREQQCVYYRTPATGARSGWVRELLASVNPRDPANAGTSNRQAGTSDHRPCHVLAKQA